MTRRRGPLVTAALALVLVAGLGPAMPAQAPAAPAPVVPAQPAPLEPAALEKKIDELLAAHAKVSGQLGVHQRAIPLCGFRL